MARRAVVLLFGCLSCVHAPSNRDRHGPPRIADYIRGLESPTREVVRRADEIVRALALPSDAVVADLGCGPGALTLAAARALERGLVYAVDVEPAQLDRLNEQLRAGGLEGRVVPVLAVDDDSRLPRGLLDAVLIIDTYHHFDDRPAYFARLRERLKPTGRIVVIDWDKGPRAIGPPPEKVIAKEQVIRELAAAGFRLAREIALLEHQFFLVFELPLD